MEISLQASSRLGALHLCQCGTEAELEQLNSQTRPWRIRCRRCRAYTIGNTQAEVEERWNRAQILLYERTITKLRFANGLVKDCCQDLRNMTYLGVRYDITTYVCRVCGCRHRRMWAEPMKIGLS